MSDQKNSNQLTLSVEDSRVSPLVLPASNEAKMMTVTSGQKCCALLPKSGRVGSLLKMLLESSTWNSTLCLLRWKPKVTPHGRLLFQLVAWVQDTEEIESGLWATPNTMDHMADHPDPIERYGARKGRTKPGNLREQVSMMYPTPTKRLEKRHLDGVVMAMEGSGKLNPTWVEWLMGYPEG